VRSRKVVLSFGALAIVLAVALAACGGGGKGTTKNTKPISATSSTTKPKPILAPLTGLPDPTGESKTRAALTVKIDNTQKGHPKYGVEQADVVYEEIVEGGITRLAAIFNSHAPDRVGPVRSVRKTDQSIVWPIGGLFAYSGGAQYALDSIKTAPVILLDEDTAHDGMFRDHSRNAPWNLYGIAPKLFSNGGTPVPPPPLFTYRAANEAPGGVPVARFHVGFGGGYGVSYAYNATASTWARTVDDPGTEASTPENPRNVIVMFTDYVGGVGVIGSEANLTGSGNAIVFTGGHRIDGRWIRPDRAKPARFVDSSGRTIGLTPGQTWVELAPTGIPVS
jgi:hypothetical protein